MKVRWTRPAEADLDEIARYIAQDSLDAALSVQARLVEAAAALVEFPHRGRPGRVAKTRELVVSGTPYLAVYTVEMDTIWILHLVHGAQDWPPGSGA